MSSLVKPGSRGPSGVGVGFCDALRFNAGSGSVEWIDRPLGTTFESLIPYEVVRRSDEVRLVSGYGSFNHTVATGTLLLFQGGFELTDCPDLPPNALSEIVLAAPASLEHSIAGIMNPDEHVLVVGEFLAIEVNAGRYTLTGEAARETVEVESGRVTVIDPDGDRHELHAGDEFTWPIIIGDPPDRDDGPALVATEPADYGSVRYTDVVLNYMFDQPVVSIGEESSFCLGETAGVWQGYGTLEELAATTPVSVTWNTEGDVLTIGIPGTYPRPGFLARRPVRGSGRGQLLERDRVHFPQSSVLIAVAAGQAVDRHPGQPGVVLRGRRDGLPGPGDQRAGGAAGRSLRRDRDPERLLLLAGLHHRRRAAHLHHAGQHRRRLRSAGLHLGRVDPPGRATAHLVRGFRGSAHDGPATAWIPCR